MQQTIAYNKTVNPPVNFDRKNHRTKRSVDRQQIIAIDGEGYNSENDHHYDLICAAGNGWERYLWKDTERDELTAEQIFDFLLSLADEHGKALYFIYGGSYDFSMWVKRLPENVLRRLNKAGKTKYFHYTISYKARREIIISDRRTVRFRRTKSGKCTHSYGRSIHIYDVIGFFQSSFVKALEDWNTASKSIIDNIANMKQLRGKFSTVLKDKILHYCLDECRLLVKLGESLREAAIKAGIKPRAWYGAGALATTLLTQNHVKDYINPVPQEVAPYLLHAYFGGRTDISKVGFIKGGFHYDISSAYPTAMVNHPCMVCGQWKKSINSRDFLKENTKYSIWHVKWQVHGVKWGPFPYRLPSGSITYPCCGEGYYHRIEIQAAQELYPNGEFEISDGVIYRSKCNHKPFTFIIESAHYRLELKAKKDAAHKPLKLGLNSLYGKTAQTLGGRKGKPPPYQCFYWAGFTTAITRAKMLNAIKTVEGEILSIATDGLISSGPIPNLNIGPNLGDWERTTIIEGILVKPGIYKWRDSIGEYHYGTRGFTKEEANWDEIEEQWRNHRFAGYWRYPTTRFIGLRQALHRGAKWREYFGKWYPQLRKLTFLPEINRRDIEVPLYHDAIPDLASSLIPELCELKSICLLNSGPSTIYHKRMPEELNEQELEDWIDEDQP